MLGREIAALRRDVRRLEREMERQAHVLLLPARLLDWCADCAVPFSWLSVVQKAGASGQGCPPCRAARQRMAQAISRARGKALRKGAAQSPGADMVDPHALCLAYGERCFLCETPTPWSLRGLHLPDSPEHDHWQPVTKHGAHTWENSRNLCRTCNIEKSNRWPFDGITSRVLARREQLRKQIGLPLFD